MATNLLGSAFVRIVPVMDGAWRRMGEQITAPVRAAVTEAARLDGVFTDAGRAAQRAAGDVGAIGDAARQAGGDAGRLSNQLAEAGREGAKAAERTEGGWKAAFGKIGAGSKLAFGAAGAAAGAAFGVGLSQAMESQAGGAKLAAQLGLDATGAAAASRVSAQIYRSAWGESTEAVNEAIRGVYQHIGEGNEGWLRDTAQKATAVTDIWDQDVSKVTAAVGQMLNTGMARSADEAFDIIAAGLGSTANRADDLLDTFNEYSTQFRRIGLDGATSLGLIQQAINAGARDSDQVADALGQFGELTLGGSQAVVDAYKAIGLNADDMAAKIGKGGPAAAGALQQTLDALRNTTNQQTRLNAQTALFGDPGAVMGAALTAMNPAAVAASGGMDKLAGSMDRSMQAMEGSASRSLESIKRGFLGGLGDLAATVLPPLVAGAGKIGEALGPAFASVRTAAGEAFGDLAPKVGGFVDAIRPGLTAIGEFATNSAWPAIKDLGAIFQGLWGDIRPVAELIRDVLVFQFNAMYSVLANQLGPALSGLTGFVRSNQTTITALAVAIGAGVAAFYAYRGAVAAVQTAQYLWQVRTLLMGAAMGGFTTAIGAVRGAMIALKATMLANPFGFALVAVTALVAGFIYAWKNSETFRNVVTGAWEAVKGAFVTSINFVVGFVQQWWPYLVGILGGPIGLLVVTVIKHWDSIKGAFSAATSWLVGFVQQWWPYLLGLVTGPIGLAVGLTIRYWDEIKSAFGAALGWIRDQIVIPVMNGIKGGIDTALGAIKTAFQTTVTAIGTVWDGLKRAAGTPVNFVIGTVYNNGIRKAFNLVAGLIGVDKLAEAPMLQLRRGGRLPGYGGGDILPALLEPGETVVPKHLTSLFAPMFARAGIPGFARGGLVGDIWNATGGKALGAAGDVVGEIAGAVVGFVRGNLAAGLSAALSPVKGLIRSTLGEGDNWKGWLGRLGIKPMDALVNWVRGKDEAAAPDVGPVGAGVQRWAGVASAVLREVGQPLTWLPLLLKRMNQESGGSQFAQNNWDINAKNGIPSKGLMQVIPPTFNAYAGPYRSKGIFDPYANIYAAVQYSLSRYGSLGKAWNRVGGYDTGGPLHPGWTLAYNGTGKDEWVSREKPGGAASITINQTVDARGASDPRAFEVAAERANAAMLRDLTTLLQQGEGAS